MNGEITPEMLGVNEYKAKLVRMLMPTSCYHSPSTSPVCALMIGIRAMFANWVIAIHTVVFATASVLLWDIINGTENNTVYVITVFITITKIASNIGTYFKNTMFESSSLQAVV